MGIPTPLTKAQVPTELHKIYDQMQKDIGSIPNIFGVVARFPAALKTLIQFYNAVMNQDAPPNAVKDFRTRNQMVSQSLYAEGVVLQSLGSAQPRSGEASPWVTIGKSPLRRRRYTEHSANRSFLWNAFGVLVFR